MGREREKNPGRIFITLTITTKCRLSLSLSKPSIVLEISVKRSIYPVLWNPILSLLLLAKQMEEYVLL